MKPPSCFVIMPFGGVWDEYYTRVYKPAIEDAELEPVRADEVFRAGSVLQEIVHLLSQSKVVLADITETNRNVHYELGLAHALGKPAVLVAPKGMTLFFDVGQERMVTYDKNDAFWGPELHKSVVRALVATVRDPASAIPTAFVHLKPARVEVDEVVVRLRRIEEKLIELTRPSVATTLPTTGLWRGVLKGLPEAEEEAERLLRNCDEAKAIRELQADGYAPAMAEAAVAAAASRLKANSRARIRNE